MTRTEFEDWATNSSPYEYDLRKLPFGYYADNKTSHAYSGYEARQQEINGLKHKLEMAEKAHEIAVRQRDHLMEDAERYRLLREENAKCAGEGHGFAVVMEVRDDDENFDEVWVGTDLDLVVDKARGKV